MSDTWTNWARNQSCVPTAVERPSTEAELAAVVKGAAAAGRTVKVVGSGHSFTDIACTTGDQVRLDRYDRVLAADRESGVVTVQAGITIAQLNDALAEHGLAMPNLGDIAYQTISGAISTGTHGTGENHGALATFVIGLDVVTGDGSVVHCSATEEPELFAAARVGLGAVGALSTVTLQTVPAFDLHKVEEPMSLDDILGDLDEFVAGNDHFEFYWWPHTDRGFTIRNNRTPLEPSDRSSPRAWYDDVLLPNGVLGALSRIGRANASWIPSINKILASGRRVERIDRSDRIFTSPRLVRFYEMEYGFPREHVKDVVRGLQAIVDDTGVRVNFPVEVRFVKEDDVWLSMAHDRPSAFVAVHVSHGMQYEQYFRAFESMVDSIGGRPHWGKLHFQTAASLRTRYARFDDFLAVRDRVDPERRFANAYTERVLGP